ncbi:glutaredoxin domain-containing cysteine-rich protein 2 [Bufo gargarizans]|uniref:glutaredoxin domain-containing cysteine-rich protein 2 n=1 Tax=Bufo gargarizans TaxID=30331 RepID=UPI001CF2E48C|nr:glutaredoxin domain-containing cysteine-rich protein 2 [Bufo gargarizans]
MEEQRKLSQRYEDRPRKVRFKISSAYSGRVLKQVYEDGQELESPDEEYPHSFLHDSFESSEHYYNPGETHPQFYPTARLTAQRISVFRDGTSYRLAGDPKFSGCHGMGKSDSDVIDFGKIIIYTSNLKIIKTPVINTEESENTKWSPGRRRRAGQRDLCPTANNSYENSLVQQHTQEEEAPECSQCKGSGCAPCSLCHGSKFSMLANRFKESYRALRCPACDEKGLQPCQMCTDETEEFG